MNARLTLFLATLLGAACSGGGKDDSVDSTDTGTPPLDDIACTDVDIGEACPSAADAADRLVGTETCESPIRRVVATGELVSEDDVAYTGYGGYFPAESADTGTYYMSKAHRCCYEAAYIVPDPSAGCTIGRPLTHEGEQVTAGAVVRRDWMGSQRPDVDGLSDAERELLARAWLHDALMEHASIPAFARVALELTALGAPPELVRRTQEAMADEIAHARACFALASAYAGQPLGPGAMEAPPRSVPSLAQFAVETFREGCVGETLAVGRAAVQLRDATDPTVRSVLEQIIADETRHAQLAWDTVRWALQAGGDPVRQALQAEVEALTAPVEASPQERAHTRQHGLPEARELTAALADLVDDVVRPTARELLARAA